MSSVLVDVDLVQEQRMVVGEVLLWGSTEEVTKKRSKCEDVATAVTSDERFAFESVDGTGAHVLLRSSRVVKAAHGDSTSLLLETDSIPQYPWPAAAPFAAWLGTPTGRGYVAGKNVLELGSGTGIAGFAATASGAALVVLSDCSLVSLALLELTRGKLEPTVAQRCVVSELRWGDEAEADMLTATLSGRSGMDVGTHALFDVIIGTDVFYFQPSLKAGLATARQVLRSGGVFLCASCVRSDRMETDLYEIPGQSGFSAEEIDMAGSCVGEPEEGGLRVFKWVLQDEALRTASSGLLSDST